MSDNFTSYEEVPYMTILRDVSTSYADIVVPVTVLLCVYLVIGVLGNALVILVYWAKKKPVSEHRYLIPFLAVADLCSCAVSGGTGIFVQVKPLLFYNNIGCITTAFLGMMFAGISAYMLLLIALERYLKLCKPLGKQITIFEKKVAMGIICVFSILLATPALFIYTSEQRRLEVKNGTSIPTWTCDDNGNTAWHMAYKIIMLVVIFVNFFVLIILYCSVLKCIITQGKLRKHLTSSVSPASSTKDGNCMNEEKKQTCKSNNVLEPLDFKPNLRRKSLDQQGIRITIMFIFISIIYTITYGPKVGLMIAQTLNNKFWLTIPRSQFGLYRFIHTFFIINSIVNPIIYFVMDGRFQRDLKKTLFMCKK